jgi:hypothetical protein
MSPDFPGFSSAQPFFCTLDIAKDHCIEFTDSKLREALNSGSDFSSRVKAVVSLISDRLVTLAEKDPAPDIVVCAMPRMVEEACGPEGRKGVRRKIFLTDLQKWHRKLRQQEERTKQGFLDFFSEEEAAAVEANLYRDFHDSLKAHAMRSKLPTQLIWESTLLGTRGTEDEATKAWNFFTALYYKAGNLPWELEFPTPRTCFVGITFYRESPDPNAFTRTCLAQAFSETGEGLVLKGERVTWDKERDKKPHLGKNDAYELLQRVLELYRKHFGDPPKRVVVHKTSRYWPEELEGLKAALGDIPGPA